jgi:hypothetical protein
MCETARPTDVPLYPFDHDFNPLNPPCLNDSAPVCSGLLVGSGLAGSGDGSDLRAAAGESVLNLDSRNRVVRVVARSYVTELKASLVHRPESTNQRINE